MKEGFSCLQVYVMLTRLQLKRGEGKLIGSPEFGSSGRRERLPKCSTLVHPHVVVEFSDTISHEGEPIMTNDERAFRKDFFDMPEMVKVLYEERNSRL